MDEFEFISRFRKGFSVAAPDDVRLPNGDDCAVFDGYAITMDAFLEGVHFKRAWMGPAMVGYKSVAVNLSDLAAVGAAPYAFLVDLAVPKGIEQAYLDELALGMSSVSKAYGLYLMGGNVTGSLGGLGITIAMIGKVGDRVITRAGARPGDAILVSGYPGRAEVGRRVLDSGMGIGDYRDCVDRFQNPVPRLDLVNLLHSLQVGAAIDISDGFLADLGHICFASGCGADIELDALPIHNEVRRYADVTGEDLYGPLLAGGEEYELIVTARGAAVPKLVEDADFTVVGRIREGRGVSLLQDGRIVELPGVKGWSHLG